MDREQEEYYIDLAAENPEMLCSEAPDEILEACAADAEPTAFLEEFFGYVWPRGMTLSLDSLLLSSSR